MHRQCWFFIIHIQKSLKITLICSCTLSIQKWHNRRPTKIHLKKVNSFFFFSQRICRTTSPSFSSLLPFNLCGSLLLLPRLVPLAVVVALLQYSLASSSWFPLSISHTPRCCRRVPDSNISCNYHNQILPSRNLFVGDWDTRELQRKSNMTSEKMSQSVDEWWEGHIPHDSTHP